MLKMFEIVFGAQSVSVILYVADRKDVATMSMSSRQSSSRSPTPGGAVSALELAQSAPSVVRDQLQWTIFMSRVNLPAVLNDPTLTRRETDFFKKTWGEDFEKSEVPPSPHLPHITSDSFRKYLTRTSAVSVYCLHYDYYRLCKVGFKQYWYLILSVSIRSHDSW